MLPGIGPLPVAEDIANGIAGDGISIITRKQIAPVGVAIGIGLGGKDTAQDSGGVGILTLTENVAGIIIGPGPALACPLVILPG